MAVKKKKRKQSIPRKDFGLASRGERITVPIDQVRANPWNPNEQTEDMQGKTRRSLQRFGIVAEVLVREIGPTLPERKGKADEAGYEIIDGEHRWRECQLLNVPELEVRNLGEVSDYEAMQITGFIDELSGSPEPLKLAELISDLNAAGHRAEMEEVFPFTKDEIDGLARLPETDEEFLNTASTRLKRKIKDNGVPFKLGKRKAQLPVDLGKRLIRGYEAIGAERHSNDVVAVASRLAEMLEARYNIEEDAHGEEEEGDAKG